MPRELQTFEANYNGYTLTTDRCPFDLKNPSRRT